MEVFLIVVALLALTVLTAFVPKVRNVVVWLSRKVVFVTLALLVLLGVVFRVVIISIAAALALVVFGLTALVSWIGKTVLGFVNKYSDKAFSFTAKFGSDYNETLLTKTLPAGISLLWKVWK